DVVHDVERRADHRCVLAQHLRPCDWKAFRMQSGDDAVFAIHRVRGRQELARRFSAQHETAAIASGDAVGGIRLAALELLELRDAKAEVFLERAAIDAMPLLDRLRADELLEHGLRSLP